MSGRESFGERTLAKSARDAREARDNWHTAYVREREEVGRLRERLQQRDIEYTEAVERAQKAEALVSALRKERGDAREGSGASASSVPGAGGSNRSPLPPRREERPMRCGFHHIFGREKPSIGYYETESDIGTMRTFVCARHADQAMRYGRVVTENGGYWPGEEPQ